MEIVAFAANFFKCYSFHQEIKLLYLHSLLMYELEFPVYATLYFNFDLRKQLVMVA